jgi:hypothetical protein
MDDPVDQVLGQRIVVALVDGDEAALSSSITCWSKKLCWARTVAARTAAS